jgi:radical SAM superfamily enzyme YgiQ (UPF0313 family)
MIEFHDDVFTIHPKWIDEFAVKYKRDIDLPFFCYTYPTVADPVMLEKLRDAGLSLCVMGLQSGSKSILEGIYNRTGDLDKISGAVDLLNRLGVKVILDLIGDNPFETEEDRRATVETLKSLPPVYSINRIGRLSLYENYPITNRALDQGLDLVYYPERHLYQAAETPEAAMWMSLMSLCQYEELDKDTLLRLSQMPALRKNPEILRKLDGALSKAAFWGESRISKDIVIEELTKQLADVQGRLRKIEGSFSHRACKRAKGALKKARSAIGGKAGSNGS